MIDDSLVMMLMCRWFTWGLLRVIGCRVGSRRGSLMIVDVHVMLVHARHARLDLVAIHSKTVPSRYVLMTPRRLEEELRQ